MNHQVINHREYMVYKRMTGERVYIPRVSLRGVNRPLHRVFLRARDALAYRQRAIKKIGKDAV